MNELLVQNEIGSRIFTLRGKEVMLDRDLAVLYKVETKVLNQAVKRNLKRFPSDFMFQLNEDEKNELVTKCDRFNRLKHSTANPYAFTEQGVYMLATVLKSDVAIDVNIAIMRTFAKLREFTKHYNALAKKIMELERKNDKQFKEVFKRLDNIVSDAQETDEKIMGFIKPKND
ncbi:ORF6N domain-containing protein [Sulfurovum sp.]|uniref:ORF6N domain-containing protein n=1 Tax=Sulfurovum sp. TaxID=1969726 RepID=UPI0025E72EFF|nr:ORF6N domain-containing protein [Sulfurovum sp.]